LEGSRFNLGQGSSCFSPQTHADIASQLRHFLNESFPVQHSAVIPPRTL